MTLFCVQVLQTTRLGSLLSGPLLAILLGLLLSAAGVVPPSCPAYDVVSSYVLPLAAALYLLESDVREWVLQSPGPSDLAQKYARPEFLSHCTVIFVLRLPRDTVLVAQFYNSPPPPT